MKEKMKSRSVSIAWKIIMVPTFVALLFGLLFTFFTDALLNTGFEPFTGQSWSALVSASPKIAEYVSRWLIGFGVVSLALTVSIFAITLMSFRRGERWSWYALLIIATIAWIFPIVNTLTLGEISTAIIVVIMLLLDYVALAISAKDILSKKIAPKPDV